MQQTNEPPSNVIPLQVSVTAEQELIKALEKSKQPYITPQLQIELDDFFNRCEGLFVGQLNPWELTAFNKLCDQNLARRSYNHSAGILGLAKVERIS